jgi:UDP-3-O-[3-hydroxymyristoyl] glucosamine N-acyltransferase
MSTATEAEITVARIAERLGADVEGDGQRVIRSVATLEEAQPDALSWVGDRKYLPKVAETKAAAVLVHRDWEVSTTAWPAAGTTMRPTLLRVDDPDWGLCQVLGLLAPPAEEVPVGVHPTAIVAESARVDGAAIGPHCTIGADAEVGPGTQLHAGVWVGRRARIGRDCVLWPNVVVRERVRIGDRVVIHANSTIGSDGFGYLQREGRHVKIPQIGTVVIEDDVEIGANCAIDRARSGRTRIGRGAKIDNLVQIGHNCDVGEHCILVGQCGVSGSCTLGRYVVLAGQVGVADHVQIGDGAQVAAKSGVPADIPAGAVYRGIPATELREYLRQAAAVRRLPKMAEQLRELMRRVERLESSTDDPA